MPSKAREHTPEGAEAFVHFYIEMVNKAWTEADDTILPPLSSPECKSCQAWQETVEELVVEGHRYGSDPISITKSTPVGGAPEGQQYVSVTVETAEVDIVDSEGEVVSTEAAGEGTFFMSAEWTASGWRFFGSASAK